LRGRREREREGEREGGGEIEGWDSECVRPLLRPKDVLILEDEDVEGWGK
jgi:hypothetical protein